MIKTILIVCILVDAPHKGTESFKIVTWVVFGFRQKGETLKEARGSK